MKAPAPFKFDRHFDKELSAEVEACRKADAKFREATAYLTSREDLVKRWKLENFKARSAGKEPPHDEERIGISFEAPQQAENIKRQRFHEIKEPAYLALIEKLKNVIEAEAEHARKVDEYCAQLSGKNPGCVANVERRKTALESLPGRITSGLCEPASAFSQWLTI